MSNETLYFLNGEKSERPVYETHTLIYLIRGLNNRRELCIDN